MKIAVTARSLRDTLRLRDLAQIVAGPSRRSSWRWARPALVTRILPDRFGSAWTYAGDDWAPGQLSAASGCATSSSSVASPERAALYGVVARPSGIRCRRRCTTPPSARRALDAVYVPFEAADADDFLAFAEAMDVRGASITLPFKVDLLPRVAADDLARRVGAVNTLVRDGGGRVAAEPTRMSPDSWRRSRGRLDLDGARAAILGAGGAARGAALALADAGARRGVCTPGA